MARVLLVHPSASQTAEISTALREIGCEVLQRPCILSGVDSLPDYTPELIIIAAGSGTLTSEDLLELRNFDPFLADTPVVIVAGDQEGVVPALRAGGDEVFVTPVVRDEFLLRLTQLLHRSGDRGVRGELAHIGLLELIQLIVSCGKDGKLDLLSQDIRGSLIFRQGQAIHATTAKLKGEDALLSLLEKFHEKGRFVFQAGTVEGAPETISKRTEHLLLGFASSMDEG